MIKKVLTLLLIATAICVQAQQQAPVLQFVYTRGGEVYMARSVVASDSITTLNEFNLGTVEVPNEQVKKTVPVFSSTIVMISLGSNTRYTGSISAVNGSEVIFQRDNGEALVIAVQNIKELEIVGDRHILVKNPNATRYFFAPSGIPLDKGSGYYQNAYILSNSVNFGLTGHFTLGGGVIIPLLFYITPKVSWEVSHKLYLGAGLIAATTIIPDMAISGGVPYGIATYGTTENNVTLGGGYGLLWNDGEYKNLDKPIVTVNTMVRLSDRIHLVTENWFVPYKGTEEYEITPAYPDSMGNYVEATFGTRNFKENYIALSVGLRVKTGKNSSFDFSPIYLKGERNNGFVIPYLDFVMKF